MNRILIVEDEDSIRELLRLCLSKNGYACDTADTGSRAAALVEQRRYDLALSGGSDYHGTNKPKIRLGAGYGALRVPYTVFEALQTQRARRGLPV